MSTVTLMFLVMTIVAIALALWMYLLMYKTRKLRDRFGPEYDRTLQREHGQTRRAETLLDERQKRVGKLNLRPLSPEERERFIAEWRTVQARFVDDPAGAVVQADAVVNRALQAHNYPAADFEQRAADISVEYPDVVEKYRIAHQIATSDPSHTISTEDLRRAMQDYRSLFEELVEAAVSPREEVYK